MGLPMRVVFGVIIMKKSDTCYLVCYVHRRPSSKQLPHHRCVAFSTCHHEGCELVLNILR